ncbi:MAG TPA: tetratricopeptide repeat protein [Candidatus Angelobacter sp.]
MPEPSPSSRIIRFGLFQADLIAGELRKEGFKVKLQERPFAVLAILLEQPGEVVTREQFRQRLWPADTFVDFDHSLNTSITKLRTALDDQADHSRFIATVGRRGYRFIAPVTGVPAQASELTQMSAPGVAATTAKSPPAPLSPSSVPVQQLSGKRTLRWPVVTGLAILLLGGGLFAYRFLASGGKANNVNTKGAVSSASPTANVTSRRSVAILAFRNLSKQPDQAWLSTALREMLSTELAAGEHLRMVSTEEISRVQTEVPLLDADSLSPETLAKLRRSLGSDIVVTGSYTVIGETNGRRIRIDLRIQDAVVGETIVEVATTGTENDLFDLVSRAGAHLREGLGVEARSSAEAASVRASAPSNPEAARFYAEGLARLRGSDILLARDLLREAVAAEPNYPLSHSALAFAWSELGYDTKAKEEAERAVNLSSKLSREERLMVEGSYGQVTKDWAKAVESYRALFALFPDDLDYGLGLLQNQISAANAANAQMTLDTLRKFPAPASDDPRLDLAEAGIAWLHGDASQVLAVASRAAAKSEAQGARLLLAQAWRHQGAAWRRLGDNAQALAKYAEAKRLYAAAGDRSGAAGILRDIGDTTAERGDYSSALDLYRQSLAVARELGDKGAEAADLNNMAVVFENQRDFTTAQKMYERALALYREVDNKSQANISLSNVAEVLFYRGDLAGAARRYREAIDAARQFGDVNQEAGLVSAMGLMLETQGDLAGAKNSLEHAISLWGQMDPHSASGAILELGQVQLAQDDLAAAHKSQERALAMREKLGERGAIAESRLALASVLLEEGKAAEAEANASAAATEFQAEKVPDLEAIAYALVSRSQLEQNHGKLGDARAAAERAVWLSAKSQEPLIRLFVAIVAARVASDPAAGASKQISAAALHRLQSILAEAHKFGFFELELEAQLAMGEIEMRSGRTTAGRARLAALAKAASAKDYGLIARKAAAARV